MADNFLDEIPSDLKTKIEKITSVLPHSIQIFEELYQFALSQPDQSKRKIRKIVEPNENGKLDSFNVIFKLEDASILSPLRKKLNFVFHLSQNDRQPMLSLVKNDKIEFSVSDLKTNISMATFLPVAEKNNLIYLFIQYKSTLNSKYHDPILMTLSKDSTVHQFQKMGIITNDIKDFSKCVEYMRKQAILTGFRIIDPFNTNSKDHVKSFHVECHRGTKEGTLYFLPDHILFGFKKPILLFNSLDIESITYSSITRLTFNVTLTTKDEQKYEFSMIDQTEYANIDEYVKTKQVLDKSMSEELKAKKKLRNSQQTDGEQSILKEAEAQINEKQAKNINDIAMDSDDEQNDQDFKGESDLSDGSEQEDESEDLEGEEADEADEAEDVEETEGYIESVDIKDELHHLEVTSADSFNLNMHNQHDIQTGGLEDISIDIEDEEELDLDGDEEGSGVEYD